MFQGRVNDPTGTNREIWVSPLRDVAHCMPYLIRAAIDAADKAITGKHLPADIKKRMTKELGDIAKCLGVFIRNISGENRPAGPNARAVAMLQAGLLEFCGVGNSAMAEFNKWFTRAVLGFYFDGIGEALHIGENTRPIGVSQLLEVLEGLRDHSAADAKQPDSTV